MGKQQQETPTEEQAPELQGQGPPNKPPGPPTLGTGGGGFGDGEPSEDEFMGPDFGMFGGGMDRRAGGAYEADRHHTREVGEFLQIQDQMIAETRGFASEVAVYIKTLVGNGIPFQAVLVLAREWQQAEIGRRANLDMLDRRMESEG